MQNKKTIGLVVGFVLVAVIFFFIGNQYGKSKNNAVTQNGNSALRNFTGGQNGGQFTGGQRGARTSGGNVIGTILSKDANSITVQLNSFGGGNGGASAGTQTAQGSKIVFYTGSTTVMKTVDGTAADLTVGKMVTISGTANPDGSVNAESIQLRNALPNQVPVSKTQGQ